MLGVAALGETTIALRTTAENREVVLVADRIDPAASSTRTRTNFEKPESAKRKLFPGETLPVRLLDFRGHRDVRRRW